MTLGEIVKAIRNKQLRKKFKVLEVMDKTFTVADSSLVRFPQRKV